MNIEEFRNYCLSKKGCTEEFPFDEVTLVLKVLNKMFALTGLDDDFKITLKCEPQYALELREHFTYIKPGYHMNKNHWNTIIMDDTIPNDKIIEWIDHSYDQVVKKLSKKDKQILQSL